MDSYNTVDIVVRDSKTKCVMKLSQRRILTVSHAIISAKRT